jgi:D-alanyl-D-alanine carboxypeptidase
MARASFTIKRNGKKIRTVSVTGKSYQDALSAGRRMLNAALNPKPKRRKKAAKRKKKAATRKVTRRYR